MDNLTATQRRALAQLQAITNGESDVAKSVLESVDWDVQTAAELIFDTTPIAGPSVAPRPATPRTPMESLELDDSQQANPSPRRRAYSFIRYFPPYPTSFLSLLAFPLNFITSIFRFIFGVLRIPIPRPPFTSLNFYRPLPSGPLDPRSVADRWVRALEEETGTICVSRACVSAAGASSGTDAGPSSLTSRTGGSADNKVVFEEGRKLLPDFILGSYEGVLRMCQQEAKIACVILVSEEHDDVTEFKRSTLTDPGFVRLLYDNDIIMWGGDIRDPEAWAAAQKLQATTYPFVAFLALQPRRGTRSPSSSTANGTSTPPALTILSRHQGRCTPSSTAPTSALTLTTHLTSQLLPRVSPFLERIRTTARERERDRILREEQDRAFRDSARRDRERIQEKMEEERRELEERKRMENEKILQAERREAERAAEESKARVRMEWRQWARRTYVKPESTTVANGSAGTIRIAIRLPGGDGRFIRQFYLDDTLTNLYAYVDSQFIPASILASSDPIVPPQGSLIPGSDTEACIEAQIRSQALSPPNFSETAEVRKADAWWGFKLVLTYPRRELVWAPRTTLRSVDWLKGGAQIVVEKIEVTPGRGSTMGLRSAGAASPTSLGEGEDEEYDTESD